MASPTAAVLGHFVCPDCGSGRATAVQVDNTEPVAPTMTIEQLTPREREEVQLVFLRRWLAQKNPKGAKRHGDRPRAVPVVSTRWPPPWKRS